MLNSYYTKEIIEHQGVNVKKINKAEKYLEIHIEKAQKAHKCPVCGK